MEAKSSNAIIYRAIAVVLMRDGGKLARRAAVEVVEQSIIHLKVDSARLADALRARCEKRREIQVSA